MKILFIAGHDSDNFVLVNVIKSFEKNGDDVKVLCLFSSDVDVRMFDQANIPYDACGVLTDNAISWCDFIIATSAYSFYTQRYDMNKYIFIIHQYLFSNWFRDADFIFTSNADCFKFLNEYPYKQAKMAIGNPQYDKIAGRRGIIKKQILYIETGFYPFGSEGRVILADLLLKIADKNRDYKVIVKPRILPGETSHHTNNQHLYRFILGACDNRLPDNLVLLKEHTNLEELVSESETIIAFYSQSYIQPFVSGKNLVIITDIPNNDTYNQRKRKLFDVIENNMKDTGCLVHYSEVLNYMPHGIKPNRAHLERQLSNVSDISGKIVEVTEYIYKNLLSKGKFPQKAESSYANYKDITEDSQMSFKVLESNRIYNSCLMRIQFTDRTLSVDVDYSSVYELMNAMYGAGLMKQRFCDLVFSAVDRKVNELIFSLKDALMNEKRDQAVLLHRYFFNGMYNDILSIDEEKVLCVEIYAYIKARLAFSNGEYSNAINYFKQYFELIQNHYYEDSVADLASIRASAWYNMGLSYVKMKNADKAKRCFKKCAETEPHRMAQHNLELLEI